jgi:hypothetical protein
MLATRENLEVLEDKTLMLRCVPARRAALASSRAAHPAFLLRTEAAGFQRRAVTLRRCALAPARRPLGRTQPPESRARALCAETCGGATAR